jgi:CheY-like chemotaxis protein
MEAIGTLASGIAHDFNNILAVILGSIDLMLLGKVDPASREHADRAKKACLRGRELVQQILSTSRKQHTERIEIDPAPVIMETVKFLRATLPSAIDLRTEIQPIPFSIKMDPIELEQILMNLCTNAAHALGKKAGSITVSAGMAESPLKDRPVFVEAAESLSDPALLIEIRDTGGGIPNDVLPRIFEPFFTTKKDAGGTGLGLAVVQGIVRSCGGRILVRSELGQGTSFGIILPAAKKAGQSFTKRTETVSTSQLNVLYVDDQPELVEIAQHYLTHLGHRVIGFTSSVEALSAIKSHPHDFDVLITDNSMPVMNGLDLIKRVKMIKSDLPVILCTGHNPFESQEESENLGITVVLPKPYTFDDLISVATQAVQRS